MTGSFPTPTWGDIDRFCKADEWESRETTDHVRWEKVLPTGEFLATHRSLAASKTIKPGVFGTILRTQLKVSREEFWRAIDTGKPVDRPVELEPQVPVYPAWLLVELRKYGVYEDEIRTMTPAEAEELLWKKRSSPA